MDSTKYKSGDEVWFMVLNERSWSKGIFRGKAWGGFLENRGDRYLIQDINDSWKMPSGKNHCFSLTEDDFVPYSETRPKPRPYNLNHNA